MQNSPQLSFLLVNFNMRGLVEKCVANIIQHTGDYSYEILIADNSTDPAFTMDERWTNQHARVSLHRLKENKGFGDALTHLLKSVGGEVVFIMHPDVEFQENCIPGLMDFLKSHPRAGIISPNIFSPGTGMTKIRLHFPTISSEFKCLVNTLTYIVCKRKFMTDEVLWDRRLDVKAEMVMSICMVIRAQVLSAAGPIPDSLKIYYTNDYLSWKAGKLGWDIHYVRDAAVIHFERYSDDKLYSGGDENIYKKSNVPIIDKMEQDKFAFLRFVYPRPYLWVFKWINVITYCVHILASVKQTRKIPNYGMTMYSKAIRSVLTG